ncbi:Formate dehydrogenase subunit alpha precursor [compost metagenome]
MHATHASSQRLTTPRYRAPGSDHWEDISWEDAITRVAQKVRKTRDETFIERLQNGKVVNATTAIFSLGGATLDIEWNHIHQKLMRGLGIVAIENQARI